MGKGLWPRGEKLGGLQRSAEQEEAVNGREKMTERSVKQARARSFLNILNGRILGVKIEFCKRKIVGSGLLTYSITDRDG